MQDDDLIELFRSLDNGGPTDSPPYADDLWAELDLALTRQESSATEPLTSDADIIELRPRPQPRGTRFPTRGLLSAVAVAAAVLLLVLVLPFDQRDDVSTEATQPPDPTSTVAPTPSAQSAGPTPTVVPVPGPRLTVPADACQRYTESQPTLVDLAERAADGGVTVEDIEAAKTALLVLQADLIASGEYTDADTRGIDFALEALSEASIEIEMGLDQQAAGSLSAAVGAGSELLLPLGAGEEVAQLCVDG